jgi:hypothetical protein
MDAINGTRAIIKRKRRAAYRLISNRVRGEMLSVTLEEVIALGLTTMTPVDETQSDALQRRRHHQRDYARKYGRVRRAKAGAVPRAKSASRTRPWETCGMKRATWYRKGKPTSAAHVTSDERAAVRKAQDTERKRLMRRANGAMPRAVYQENALSRTRPWEAEGISPSTWKRRRRAASEPSVSAKVRQIRQVAILGGLPRERLKVSTSSFLTLNESLTLRVSPSGAEKLQFVRRPPESCLCRSSAAAETKREALTPMRVGGLLRTSRSQPGALTAPTLRLRINGATALTFHNLHNP